ncbi:MAG: FAD-dependent oxidoreductase [Deltaproteobacteria bacterium]|nr:FAD-dependent oxidoreductase [Deltaproteobacteria bacterium]
MVEGRTHKPVIDRDKCESCGICIQACPAEVIPEMREEKDSLRGCLYGNMDKEPRLNQYKRYAPPRCEGACPIGQDVRGYMRLIRRGKYGEALELIRDVNPLPSVCGYVCHHPCEKACTRGEVDDPLSIRALKRFVADWDDGKLRVPSPPATRRVKVAIVGSGPAGLTAAYELARVGYAVEIIESYHEPGGMLAWAIPSFRLPGAVLKRDIDYIRKMGVEIRTGILFGRDVSIQDFRRHGTQAVILAVGTQQSVKMNIRNEDGLQGFTDCLSFLKRCSEGDPPPPGECVLVIGGGNAAIDTARCALRMGAGKVSLIYRRTLEEMPAEREHVKDALLEGIEVVPLTLPIGVLESEGKLIGLECVKTRPAETDSSGRKRPVPVEGSRFEIHADTVISAVGQQQDYSEVFRGLSYKGENMEIDRETMRTAVDDVFAAGDFLNGPSTVVEAMASGRKVAKAVEKHLKAG